MKAAYADPPYLGCGKSHYGDIHERAADFDDPRTHRELIARLCDEYEAWALSLHTPSLQWYLATLEEMGLRSDNFRIGAWVKPFAAFKPNVTRAYCWEPVIFRFSPARPRSREQDTWRDFISCPITMRRGFTGAKPERFCHWVFEGLNLEPADEFTDLFPGSGAAGSAWESWRNRAAPEQLTLGQPV